MVAVFAVFAGTGMPSIKEIGLGLAVAIALDATLVRLVLVPATMELMGSWNWWLPKRVDRVLPHTDFESGSRAASRRSISAASSPTATRSCSSVSRSRRVTVSSSIVWWSTVTPERRADLVLAAVALADRAAGVVFGGPAVAQLLVDRAPSPAAVLFTSGSTAALNGAIRGLEPQHRALLAADVVLVVGVAEQRQEGAVDAGGGLDHVRDVSRRPGP